MDSRSRNQRRPAEVRRLPEAGPLDLPDADIHYLSQFLHPESADFLFKTFLAAVCWTQPRIGSPVGLSIHPGLLPGMETLEQFTDTQA